MHDGVDHSLIFIGDEARGHLLVQHHDACEGTQQHREGRRSSRHEAAQDSHVAPRQGLKAAVEGRKASAQKALGGPGLVLGL